MVAVGELYEWGDDADMTAGTLCVVDINDNYCTVAYTDRYGTNCLETSVGTLEAVKRHIAECWWRKLT